MPVASSAGRAIGRTTWISVVNVPAPSIAAACSTSTGSTSMFAFISQLANGMRTVQYTATSVSGLLRRPKPLKVV